MIRFSALGDIVLTTGPIKALREQYPDVKIELLTSSIGAEVFSEQSLVDRVHTLDKSLSFWGQIQFFRSLGPYDIIVDLHANLRSYLASLVNSGQVHRIEKNSRSRRAFVKDKFPRPELKKHVVEKYYDCFQKALKLDDRSLEELRPTLLNSPTKSEAYNNFRLDKAIVLHADASQKNKIWPYFDELVETLLDQKIPVVIVGQYKDALISTPKNNFSELCLDLQNKTSLKELIEIMSQARAVITTDSGPMHIAIATGTPTIALFGPTTKEFGFYPVFENTRVVEHDTLECRPCHVHGGNTCPLQHHRCMKDLSVSQVISALKKYI